MKPLVVLLGILMFVAPASAFAQDEELQLLYPRAALQQGIGGVVTVECEVRADGGLACEVLRELPAGMGFGDAVLFMSEAWRMPSERDDGTSTVGARLIRTVQFSPGPPPSVGERRDQADELGWRRTPTANDFARHFPIEALRRGIDGEVMLECLVNSDHTLACAVEEETPSGYGFGRAALRIAESFRMADATRDGVPTAGGRVRVPIRFNVD